MGKDDKKEDSGFGFKDAAKAQETLRLLEQHEPNYRRLTVRGLLGRAKRVLSMTKAEDKVKNIKEAMEVFEQWLADLEASKDKTEKKVTKKVEKKESSGSEDSSSSDVDMDKPEKKEKQKPSLPSDTVPGLGFKDAATAESSLRELQGRDPEYARLAVKGLIGRAKRVLTCTRDEMKISNIKAAMAIFEQFLDDFEAEHRGRQNNPYLSLGVVRTAEKLAGGDVTDQQRSFISAYSSVRGEYKRLRTVVADTKTWDIVRNTALKELKEKYADAKLFTDKDDPTPEHIQMLLWAYSPEPARTKKYVPETHEERKRRRDSSSDEKREGTRERDSSEEKPREGKRRRESSSDEGNRRSSGESPTKKSKE